MTTDCGQVESDRQSGQWASVAQASGAPARAETVVPVYGQTQQRMTSRASLAVQSWESSEAYDCRCPMSSKAARSPMASRCVEIAVAVAQARSYSVRNGRGSRERREGVWSALRRVALRRRSLIVVNSRHRVRNEFSRGRRMCGLQCDGSPRSRSLTVVNGERGGSGPRCDVLHRGEEA
jgi:hypothetical protein